MRGGPCAIPVDRWWDAALAGRMGRAVGQGRGRRWAMHAGPDGEERRCPALCSSGMGPEWAGTG